ncbi:trafficking protein particle complex subunit 3-like [Convolutriloba macropyga]|uniref:trafficking protein particle complex subunit 3-like n=1 Tax=Convolutriloba macropyga TaxID=536237 RepID=UPI003F51F516
MARQSAASRGEMRRVNVDLLSLSYGTLVFQLIRDYENDTEVNAQLEKIGVNIGNRLIEDFLSRSQMPRCRAFQESVEVICKSAFKQYFGIASVEATNWDAKMTECSLILKENPLADFVELPEKHQSLFYSNILCGVIKGALTAVHQDVQCWFVQDVLLGHPTTEIKLKFLGIIKDTIPAGEHD